MSVKLQTEHNLEFPSLKEVAQAHLSLHLSKCHIVGNYMSRLILIIFFRKLNKHLHPTFYGEPTDYGGRISQTP